MKKTPSQFLYNNFPFICRTLVLLTSLKNSKKALKQTHFPVNKAASALSYTSCIYLTFLGRSRIFFLSSSSYRSPSFPGFQSRLPRSWNIKVSSARFSQDASGRKNTSYQSFRKALYVVCKPSGVITGQICFFV